ncbi:MAG: serine hydrolase domain-containing protein [Planctomycetota bacterium]
MATRRRLVLALLGGALVAPAGAQTNASPARTEFAPSLREELDAVIGALVGRNRAVGVAAGVRYGDAVWTAGAGQVRRPDGAAPDADTRFEIGSITKVYTGVLLADAVERGEVQLADPVADHLPEDLPVPVVEDAPITLRDLSTHRSGLPRMPQGFRPGDPVQPYADYDAAALYETLADLRLRVAPGVRYAYSNLAVGLLGHALERASGTAYPQLMRQRVLAPLGLSATEVWTPASGPRPAAAAAVHNAAGQPVQAWRFDVLAAAGAITSSVADQLRFIDANLGRLELDSDDRLARSLAVAREVHSGSSPGPEVGLGWHRDPRRPGYVWHNGGTAGSRSFLALNVERQAGVVVLSNTSRSVDAAGWRLLEILGALE